MSWINAAAGLIGDGPVNSMYLGVLAVGFVGTLIAGFQPHGVALALFATAVARMLVPVVALVIWKGEGTEYAPWADVGQLDFERPPARYPPLGGG